MAKDRAPGKVEWAFDLVEFDKEMEPAMLFVFGGAMICKDSRTAKLVTYDKDIRVRTITVDGDVYEPGAVITGGSSSKSGNMLVKLHKMKTMEARMLELK